MNLNEYMTRANVTQAVLGDALGVSQGAVGQWTLPGRRIPAKHCPAIEKFTGRQVTCEELRPDIDWAYLRSASPEQTLIPGRPIDGAVVRETIGKTRRVGDRKSSYK